MRTKIKQHFPTIHRTSKKNLLTMILVILLIRLSLTRLNEQTNKRIQIAPI